MRRLIVSGFYDDAEGIKKKFNSLVEKFEDEKHYVWSDKQSLSSEEDIASGITQGKDYQAVFFQLPIKNIDDKEEWRNVVTKKVVWFTILRAFDLYWIKIYYVNDYNSIDGQGW